MTEKVIETLENAVRQRVRAALEARERRRLEEGAAPEHSRTPTRAAMALMQMARTKARTARSRTPGRLAMTQGRSAPGPRSGHGESRSRARC